jgi:DNA-binding IclR family transcriptional regulator
MTREQVDPRDRNNYEGEALLRNSDGSPTWYERSPHDRPPEKPSPNSALERALAVIETLLASDRPIGLLEIARRLDIPRQSAHRIVNQLLDAGMMQRHLDRDRFALGPRMRRLALNTVDHSHRLGPMHGVLEDLAERTGETCNLGVLDANDVLLVDRVESHWALRVHSEVGKRLEFHSSGIGTLLVAHLPKERRHRLLTSRPLKRFTSFTLTDEDALEAEFTTIRRRGYSVSSQGTMLGLFSIAVPVRDPGGRVLAGLACQAPLMRISIEQAEKDLLPLLLDAARRMEKIIALDFKNGD